KQQKEYELKKQEIIKQQKLLEKKRKQERLNRKKANEITTLFAIDKFGIWNCDRIIRNKTFDIAATFVDSRNKPLVITHLALASKELNGVFRFFSNNIKVLPNTPHVIWGISNGQFVYFTYLDFEKSNIDNQTTNYTFTMRKYNGDLTNYQDLKNIL